MPDLCTNTSLDILETGGGGVGEREGEGGEVPAHFSSFQEEDSL